MRLPFGVASAPAVFERTMDIILQGLDVVVSYIDDVLVTGKTYGDHLCNLAKVLQRMNMGCGCGRRSADFSAQL